MWNQSTSENGIGVGKKVQSRTVEASPLKKYEQLIMYMAGNNARNIPSVMRMLDVHVDLASFKAYEPYCIAAYNLASKNSLFDVEKCEIKAEPFNVTAGLLDNYLTYAMAARHGCIAHTEPLVTHASINKWQHEGYQGEISVLRTLLTFGYDPMAQESDGYNSFHYMCCLRWGNGIHLRALRSMFDANKKFGRTYRDCKNDNGDTPLHLLLGAGNFGSEHEQAMHLFLSNGASLATAANDGVTPADALLHAQSSYPNQERALVIKKLKAIRLL